MHKAIATLVALSLGFLTACSDPADDATTDTGSPPSNAPAVGANAGPADRCPTQERKPVGPQKTPSPVEQCSGAYDCTATAITGQHRFWMHYDGAACLFGKYVLRSDGTAADTREKKTEGRWEGDAIYFKVMVGEYSWSCSPANDTTD